MKAVLFLKIYLCIFIQIQISQIIIKIVYFLYTEISCIMECCHTYLFPITFIRSYQDILKLKLNQVLCLTTKVNIWFPGLFFTLSAVLISCYYHLLYCLNISLNTSQAKVRSGQHPACLFDHVWYFWPKLCILCWSVYHLEWKQKYKCEKFLL